MYLHRLLIEDIKGFRSGNCAVDLCFQRPDGKYAGWTVVAGRNGAGKTSFLRAIALSIAGPTVARSLQESFAGWIRDGTTSGRVGTQLTYDPNLDRFERTGRLPANMFWTGLQWEATADSEPTLTGWELAKTMKQTPDRGPWGEDPKGWFIAGYGPFRRLTGHASDAQRLMTAPHHLQRLVSLFREDASLLECVQWLKNTYLRRLEQKPGAAELEEMTKRLLNDGMLPDGMQVERVDSDGLWVRQGAAILPLRDLSDGYRTAIALVLDITRHMHNVYGTLTLCEQDDGTVTLPYPGIVLIDEIDVHLHISWQQRIGFWLKKRFPNVQFIVSSHSPFVCQAADHSGLVRLPAPGETRAADLVDVELHKRIVRGTADEAALSELFGLDTTRSCETEELLEELAKLEVSRLRRQLNESEIQRLKALQLELPLTPSAEIANALSKIGD